MAKVNVNLERVARELGVSAATVSNALSGKGRVSVEMTARIRQVADRLGYVPSQAGRALRTGRSRVLGLVLPDIGNPLFPQIAQAIEAAASAAGYGILIADSHGDVHAQTDAIERLIERGVEGLVVVPRRGTRILDIGCPVAVIDTSSTPGNTVSADHWGAGELLARHLAGLGHRKVLLIGESPASNVQNDRIGGMRAGLGLAGKHIDLDVLWIETIERQAGRGCSMGLPAKYREGFTAFAAVSDLLALRALTELQRAGIAVSEDASITGFDDLIWSGVVQPGLTTLRMDLPRIASIAIDALLRRLNEQSASTSPVKAEISRVPMHLIVRQSSGPAPVLERWIQGVETKA